MSKKITYFFKQKPSVPHASCEAKISKLPEKSPFLNEVQQEETIHIENQLFHPPKHYVIPKTKIGARDRSCHHNWFKDFPWLHYEKGKIHVFFICLSG